MSDEKKHDVIDPKPTAVDEMVKALESVQALQRRVKTLEAALAAKAAECEKLVEQVDAVTVQNATLTARIATEVNANAMHMATIRGLDKGTTDRIAHQLQAQLKLFAATVRE